MSFVGTFCAGEITSYSEGVAATEQGAQAPRSTFSGSVDGRSRRRRLLPVIATAVAAVVGTFYLRAVDPNVPGHYPGCPSQSLLGIDCPGCGGMRGTYDLLHGDIAGMLDDNLLLVIALPFAVVAFGLWAYRAWTGRRPVLSSEQQARRSRWMVGALIVVLAFGVVRNLVPYLGSGPG